MESIYHSTFEKDALKRYKLEKVRIKARLENFKNLKEKDQFNEFLFCLLTPQSNAQKCWEAVEQLSSLRSLEESQISDILRSKTRFHNTKAKRVTKAKETWKAIKPHLENPHRANLRDYIAENVNGYGLKEASHFLRNIGKSDNQIAILDRHILKNLKILGIIKSDQIKNKKHYLEIEQEFLNFSKQIGIPIDELDLLFWSKENGEIFK